MPNLKADYNADLENKGHGKLLPSKNSVKKQAFGELKNVMHNQGTSKALIKTAELNKKPMPQFKKSMGKENDGAKMQHLKAKAREAEDIELLDYFDFARECCRKPYKSDVQIWSEMNVFDDAMLDNIIHGVYARDEEKPIQDDRIELEKSINEDILDINNSIIFDSALAPNTNDSLDDIILPPVELEKFDFL